MRYIILGTAGHIDHGKSSLVKALTGIDPDRLKEEKERGITIDLGFADLSYPDGLIVGIIDVPGHERLVRNMLAGAGGIDIVLLVIAADEGIMPQSREHLAICNLLKIKSGIIAITKADLVEREWLELVSDEVRGFVKGTFLENAEIVPVSSKTGFNLDLLKEKIREAAIKVEPKPTKEIARLPIDRVFTLKGFGTVVTGTLLSGRLSTDEAIEILPSGIKGKIRGLHSHGKAIQAASAGQRVAINLHGIDKESIKRGDVIAAPDRIIPARIMDAHIELLKDSPVLKNKSNVHFHLSTSETTARVILYKNQEMKHGESGFCRLRLMGPVAALAGDRFVIRRFSPVVTIGGGTIIDSSPPKRRRKDGVEYLQILASGSVSEKLAIKIKESVHEGMNTSGLYGWLKAETSVIDDSIKKLKEDKTIIQIENKLLHKDTYADISRNICSILAEFHEKNPMSPGLPKEELRGQLRAARDLWSSLLSTLPDIVVEKDIVRLKSHRLASSEASEASKKMRDLIEKGAFQPPAKEELSAALSIPEKEVAAMLKLLAKEGKLVRINDSMYISSQACDDMMSRLKVFFSSKPTMTVAEFRDILNTTRKYALPFLEYLDSNRITMRVGDIRKLLLK